MDLENAQDFSDASDELDRSLSPASDGDLPSPQCYTVGLGHLQRDREWNAYISKELWEGNDPVTFVSRSQARQARQRPKWYVQSARLMPRVSLRRKIAKQYAP